MSLPFPLYKRHKYLKRWDWERRGMIFVDDDHYDYIYNEYIRATKCDLCNKEFLKSLDRQLDHCHITGDPRNVVCQKCNIHKKDNKPKNTNTGENNIHKRKHIRYKNGYVFEIKIRRDGKYILHTLRTNLEAAIKCRDEFIEAHPEIYS
jgi:hypothetical protein